MVYAKRKRAYKRRTRKNNYFTNKFTKKRRRQPHQKKIVYREFATEDGIKLIINPAHKGFGGAMNFIGNEFKDFTSYFRPVFEEYKILKVTTEIFLQGDGTEEGEVLMNTTNATLLLKNSVNDANVNNWAELTQDPGAKVYRIYPQSEPVKWVTYPKLALNIWQNNKTADAHATLKPSPWIDTLNNVVEHYGFYWTLAGYNQDRIGKAQSLSIVFRHKALIAFKGHKYSRI